ncbi:PDDEXK nuclease domain-containing protein [Mucilaginibacter defluvii]|uniref:PDDEXK nuclease domain-containing protein n=1 Tax=Mucilaginibacter defluvii TaxID=1196019 RepID=A0ABP9FLZ3_9SPHI
MKTLNNEYQKLLAEISDQFRQGRIMAIRSVNRELISRYEAVGRLIIERQSEYGWGKSIVERLSRDLKAEFPGTSGFSARNLWDMRRFYERYAEYPNLRQLVAEIPWGHNLVILNKTSTVEEAGFYALATLQNGWSRNVLQNFIKADAYSADLKINKQHNFPETLPPQLAQQAEETIRSKYNLEFLGLQEPVREKELESKLILQIRNLLLTMGYGFAYMGNQFKIKLGRNEYFIDLLFYHRKLQCLVAVELKVGKFEPAHAAQLNFYLQILDDTIKLPQENPSIGILLCAEKDKLEVEYSLRLTNKPIGVSEYNLTTKLPKHLKKELPGEDELKALLGND